jgi:GMP synthase-like glutamine amidotransferase
VRELVVILDWLQYTQLIARRVRELGVYLRSCAATSRSRRSPHSVRRR